MHSRPWARKGGNDFKTGRGWLPYALEASLAWKFTLRA